ncbi:hypothetical protein GEMRC1_009989 [Eukaryota sp. GEM-RC1]
MSLPYKLLLVGDSAVGKSCLLLRYANDDFSDAFIPTMGVDFRIKTLEFEDKTFKLQIWDTAGKERFQTNTSSWYHNVKGIIVVFDVTNRQSFENVPTWLAKIEGSISENVSVSLVGNKIDLDQIREVTDDEARAFATEHGIDYVPTSAKTAENVELAIQKQLK